MNILLVTHRFPYPPDKGDRIRSWRLVQALSKVGAVRLATGAAEPVSLAHADAVRAVVADLAIAPLGRARWLRAAWSVAAGRSLTEGLFAAPALGDTVRRWHAERPFDIAVAFCSSVVPVLELLPNVPALVDLVDVDSEKFRQYAAAAAWPKRQVFALEARRVRALERRAAAHALTTVLCTAPEAALFRGIAPTARVEAIPNGVDGAFFAPQPETLEVPDSCAFVGAMDYRANVEGAEWFVREVWPLVRARRPNATFAIVGRDPTPVVRALAAVPGVTVTGAVPDVRPHVAGAAVAIVPLRVARGIQNKALEALAMGRALLATPAALAGLDVRPGIEAVAAETPAEWAAALLHLLDHPAARAALGAAGREYALGRHGWDACFGRWSELCRSCAPHAGTLPAGKAAVAW